MMILGLAWLFLIASFSWAFQNEPEGFRDLKWGDELLSIQGMKKIGVDPSYGGMDKYIRKSDKLRIGEAKLDSIIYCFWKGKLCDVTISVKGFINWIGLKESAFERFGEGVKNDRFGQSYSWFGNKTSMTLVYSEVSKKGIFWISSTEIFDQAERLRKEKAKEDAAKGF